MSTQYVPAAPGVEAIFAIRDHAGAKRIVSRAVIAWRMSELSGPSPVTLVDDDTLRPIDGAIYNLPIGLLFPDGHVETPDGGRTWSTRAEFEQAAARKYNSRQHHPIPNA